MATITDTTAPAPAPGPYRLTVDKYEAMIEAGILDKDDRVELIDGVLTLMSSQGNPLAYATWAVRELLTALLPAGWTVLEEKPIQFSTHGMPEPDVAILRGSRRDYRGRRPGSDDVSLIVEVADTSLTIDRGDKLAMYARAGIPAYWIVNIPDRRLEVHTEPDPTNAAYRKVEALGRADDVAVALDGKDVGRIDVGEVLDW